MNKKGRCAMDRVVSFDPNHVYWETMFFTSQEYRGVENLHYVEFFSDCNKFFLKREEAHGDQKKHFWSMMNYESAVERVVMFEDFSLGTGALLSELD